MTDLIVNSVRIDRKLPEDSYLHKVTAIRNLLKQKKLDFHVPVTFLVGENGIGKSTLIEAIAVNLGFNSEGGSINFNFSTKDTHSDLHDYMTVTKGTRRRKDGFFLRAESFYNMASHVDDSDVVRSYGGVSLHEQSHGESFLALVANRFHDGGIYILDEPEAALSPSRILELMCHMNRLVKNGSQFIISTHSPILMAFPNAELYQISEDGMKSISYKDTEHFRLTKQFLNDPERMCRYLFEE